MGEIRRQVHIAHSRPVAIFHTRKVLTGRVGLPLYSDQLRQTKKRFLNHFAIAGSARLLVPVFRTGEIALFLCHFSQS